MAFDEALAARIRKLVAKRPGFTEKKMFGGIAFLLRGNMCCGVSKNDMIVRLSRDETDAALGEPGARIFDMTGRPMQGWIVVAGKSLADDAVLKKWVGRAIAYAGSLPAK